MTFLDKIGLERLWAHILLKLNRKVDKVEGKGLSTNDFTTEEKEKLANIEEYIENATNSLTPEQIGAVASVNGKTGAVVLTADDVGAVPTDRTINNKALSADISLTASDVGAVKKTGDTMTGTLTGTNINLGSSTSTAINKLTITKKISDTQYINGSVGSNGSNLRVSNTLFTRSGSGSGYTSNTNNIDIGANNTTFSKPILLSTAAAKEDTRENLDVYSKAEVDALIPEETDLSGYYTKQETDAAIEEATKEEIEWEVIQTVKLEANTRTIQFNELQHRLLRLEFIIQNEGGEIVMPAGIITINGKTGMRIAAQKMSAGAPMYRRIELRVEDGLIVGNTSYSRSDNTSYGTETPLGNSYGLDIMNDWKIIEAISYIVNSTDDLPVGTEIVLKGVRA